MYQICQSRLNILPNKKQTVKILPKTCQALSKWRNFAKSGHTVDQGSRSLNSLLCVAELVHIQADELGWEKQEKND